MKRILLIIVSFLLASSSYIESHSEQPDTSFFSNKGGIGGHGNRAPAHKPVTIYYCAPISSVVLSFKAALGTVSILIVNFTTGEYLEGDIISSPGSFPIPISRTPGDYYVVATLPDGKQFETEFLL